MKHFLVLSMILLGCVTACRNETLAQHNGHLVNQTRQTVKTMKITVDSVVFTATLYDNPSAAAFQAMLPLRLDMSELNGNEKFYYFSDNLPVDAAIGGDIQAGDLMLYGNNCLVLFYEGLQSSYSYTKIGRIDDVNGLARALGTGKVRVVFEAA